MAYYDVKERLVGTIHHPQTQMESRSANAAEVILISEAVLPPPGILTTCLNDLSESVKHWFLETGFPLPRSEAELPNFTVEGWLENLNEVMTAKSQYHWKNLISGDLESYQLIIDERARFRDIEVHRKLLLYTFLEAVKSCQSEGHSTLAEIISYQHSLFRRASLVFLAMSQSLERTINSWKDMYPSVGDALLSKGAGKEYPFPKTTWNDEYIINHNDLDRMLSLKWLNSNLMNVFISKLNAKFSHPDNQQCVAYLDTNFAYHYILPASKPHDTLKNSEGEIRSKPLKVFDSLERGSLNTQVYQTAYENMQQVWKVLVEAWSDTLSNHEQRWKLEIHSKIDPPIRIFIEL
ncbi:hypothetical protein C8R42DRAFT_644917 [Lentinula raphanica]|nr:hypothetical protein C8R42DRAFT_644917 [Lentinula raphanica]